MFEGLVRQLIWGYLGKYIKDIQKEQLKITLWNEEVLLENVELILEAFDYLRLPFAFKQGRVGKLSIKIPWKKLGWDPIIIILEEVYICVSQRDDEEWSMDAVKRREYASKKAQLAAAELAKLSRRVCDNQTGKSFTSYITAKSILPKPVWERSALEGSRCASSNGQRGSENVSWSNANISENPMPRKPKDPSSRFVHEGWVRA